MAVFAVGMKPACPSSRTDRTRIAARGAARIVSPVAVLALLAIAAAWDRAGAPASGTAFAAEAPRLGAASRSPGWMPADQRREILDKTLTIRLAPDLSALSEDERAAVSDLLAAGEILENVYALSLHRQAPQARKMIATLARTRGREGEAAEFADLYTMSGGPIVTTLENDRVPFVPADSLVPGKNVYPWGVTKDEIERFIARHPDASASILHLRTVVRRLGIADVRADQATLRRHPALKALDPDLEGRLNALARASDPGAFYAVPYSLAYADSLARVSTLLHRAANRLDSSDGEFADYLRMRARDLLANDYEGGDAAWVTGRFGKLNAQIGAYETYDDELFGVKAMHGLSLVLRDEKESTALDRAMGGLQALEQSLPYAPHKTIRQVSVGVYDVIADFGQPRGTNTATILPNESRATRRYGRTILIRRNILTHPDIIAAGEDSWRAAMDPRQAKDYRGNGNFYRTLWHEVGHYLGPDRTRDGREHDLALEEESGTFEEMKADLVSLYCVPALRKSGYYDDAKVRAVYASGIARTFNKHQPRRDQVYPVMQLMQMNWFLEHGLLTYDRPSRRLTVHYDRYPEVVASLLEEVIAVQQAGDKVAAGRFIERWTKWDDRHESLAKAMRDAEKSRFRLVKYAALGE